MIEKHRMKYIITLSIIFIFKHFGHGQTIDWLSYYGTSQDNHQSSNLTLTTNGDVIQIIQNSQDVLIKKTSTNNTEIWSGLITNCKVYSIDTDLNGNIFLLGNFDGPTDLDPTAGTNYIYPLWYNGGSICCNRAMFVTKLNSNGDYLFSKIIDAPSVNSAFFSFPQQITVDSQNNLIIGFLMGGSTDINPSATTTIISGSDKGVIMKWNNDCSSLAWNFTFYTGGQDIEDQELPALKFDLDSQNNIYIAGLDKVQTQGVDIRLFKLNSNGQPANSLYYNYFLGGNNNDYFDDIAVLDDNRIILTGRFINNIDLNPIPNGGVSQILNSIPVTNTQFTYNDAFMVAYDSTFNVIWKKVIGEIGEDRIDDIETYNNEIYAVGNSFQTITSPYISTGGYSFIRKYSNSGNLLNEKIKDYPQPTMAVGYTPTYVSTQQLYSSISNLVQVRKLKVFDGSTYYIGGQYESLNYQPTTITPSFDFASCSNSSITIPGNGKVRCFLAKYGQSVPQIPLFSDTVIAPCAGGNVTIQILNSNGINCTENWKWHLNSCDGPIINSGSTYNFTPTTSMQIYVRGEGDINGPCQILYINTITINPFVTLNGSTLNVNIPNAIYQWFYCSNGQIIPGANSQSYSPINTGVYGVSVTSNGCMENSNCVLFSNVGVLDISPMDIKIFPNPTEQALNVNIPENLLSKEITIYDNLDKEILRFTLSSLNNLIDISYFASGLYWLKIDGEVLGKFSKY